MLQEFESLCVYIFPKCWLTFLDPRVQDMFIQITYYVAWNNYKESERDCCPALCPVVIYQNLSPGQALYLFPFLFDCQGGQQGSQEGQQEEHLPKTLHPCNCSFQSE